MIPREIDSFKATDEQGGIHAVQVMQLFRLVAGRGVSDESGRWTKTDRLRFVVDDEYEFEQDQAEPPLIQIPGLGRLVRLEMKPPGADRAA
jgi:hypothetical protein